MEINETINDKRFLKIFHHNIFLIFPERKSEFPPTEFMNFCSITLNIKFKRFYVISIIESENQFSPLQFTYAISLMKNPLMKLHLKAFNIRLCRRAFMVSTGSHSRS